jgi:hypothetical protein
MNVGISRRILFPPVNNFFKLNQDRTELALAEPLNDKIADTEEETITDTVLFATGFAGISDIEEVLMMSICM